MFSQFWFSFFCFNDIIFVSRNRHIYVFQSLKRVNFCRLSTCWFTKDELLQMYFSGILPIFEEHLYQETPFFCVLLAELQFAPSLLPPYLPLLCSPTKNPKIAHDLQEIWEEMHCMKNKVQMLKQSSLKSFLQKCADTYFMVLTNRSKSTFKEKSSMSVWCEQCIFT